ncbi:sphingosine-1-phosphate phosphatase 2 isoform X2 [Scleropages formosus]|uniref:sphingosine-1-phosphate phosphatase 2 isoform X2 n=1 Tax=Scleropages formosus TaxID=113540 RepID=UPI0010FAB1E8|nr:sphingosine-1-phosphate phosphatase 2 isoform X2 [Scleropages formosus]
MARMLATDRQMGPAGEGGLLWLCTKTRPVKSSTSMERKEKTTHTQPVAPPLQYNVRNRLLYYLFLGSAELGHEMFYITFLPCIHWNLDPFLCRRLVNMWMVVMYIGQVMKDMLKMPRPLSPPVVKLEPRVNAEYGMPSTHAMAATAISFTFLLSAAPRFQIQFEVGLLVAVAFSTLVGLSRLYTGMHSALDVICGAMISALLMVATYPAWDAFDRLQLESPLSPVLAVLVPLFLCYNYPRLDHYSTTRGDTTVILGAGAGCSVGYWVNRQLGKTFEPQGGFPVPLPALTPQALLFGCGRFLLGVAILLGTRQAMKTFSLLALCSWRKVSFQDLKARQQKEIEVPYKFATYISVGLVNTILVNNVFVVLGLL